MQCLKSEQISSKFTGLQNTVNTRILRKTGRVTMITFQLNKKSLSLSLKKKRKRKRKKEEAPHT
jgi:hypothetical protein